MDWKKVGKLLGCCGCKKYLDRLVVFESGWVVCVGEVNFVNSFSLGRLGGVYGEGLYSN